MDVVDVCSEARKVDGCADIGSGTESGAQCVKNVVHLLLGNHDTRDVKSLFSWVRLWTPP